MSCNVSLNNVVFYIQYFPQQRLQIVAKHVALHMLGRVDASRTQAAESKSLQTSGPVTHTAMPVKIEQCCQEDILSRIILKLLSEFLPLMLARCYSVYLIIQIIL